MVILLVLAVVQVGCSVGRLPEPAGEPVPDPSAFAAELKSALMRTGPQQINFSWTLEESGSRVGGRGVVRAEAPERIRLDLFGARGETYLIAALVGNEYRLPPTAAATVALPSPALLWGALGMLEEPIDADLISATRSDGDAELRYRTTSDETFIYHLTTVDGRPRLVRMERAGGQGVIETVSLEHSSESDLIRARYRDWSAYRDLTLEIESVRETDAFPPNIWSPDGSP